MFLFGCNSQSFINISPSIIDIETPTGVSQDSKSDSLIFTKTYYIIEGRTRNGKKVGKWNRLHGQDDDWKLINEYYFKKDSIIFVKSFSFDGSLTSKIEKIAKSKYRKIYYKNGVKTKETIINESINIPFNYKENFEIE